MGYPTDRLIEDEPQLKRYNMEVYKYPSYIDIDFNRVRGIYLSNPMEPKGTTQPDER